MKQFCLVALMVLAWPAMSVGQDILQSGRIDFLDLGFNNSNVNNPFWTVHINDETNGNIYDPTFNSGVGRFVFNTSGGARFLVTGAQHLFVRPLAVNWSFIGVGPGDFFRATPQNGDPGIQLVLGVATIGIPNGLFVNNQINITMSVAGITNPGQFSYYSNDDPPNSATGNLGTVLLSTLDNITTFSRFSGTQNNFNMAFSAPGFYDVDFQFSGTRTPGNGGGTITSPFYYRYTFEVGLFPVPEPSTWALLGLSALLVIIGVWQYRRRRRLALDTLISPDRS